MSLKPTNTTNILTMFLSIAIIIVASLNIMPKGKYFMLGLGTILLIKSVVSFFVPTKENSELD